MSKVFIKLNKEGIGELLKSAEMAEVVEEYAEKVKATAEAMSGESYDTRKRVTDRVGVNVFPATKAARKDNWNNNTLEKASGIRHKGRK